MSQIPVNQSFSNKRLTFPVTPHIPCGLTTPDQLRSIADLAEQYNGKLKITSGSISITGLTRENSEKIHHKLNIAVESFMSSTIRSIAVCPGNPDCPMARQNSTELSLLLDKELFGQPAPGKFRIGVSACPNCCAEVFVKDVGLYGTASGYVLVAGGNSGRKARIAWMIARDIPQDQVLSIITAILHYYRIHGDPKERLGQTLDRSGWPEFIETTIPLPYRAPE